MVDPIKDFKEWLTALAILAASFFGVVTCASALNYAHEIHNGFITTCACISLAVIVTLAGIGFKKYVLNYPKKNEE